MSSRERNIMRRRLMSSEHSDQEDEQPRKRKRAAAPPPAEAEAKAAAELPDHLVYSVFLKLPVKSLLPFRSLSKQWRDRISRCSYFAAHYSSTQRELRGQGRARVFFSRAFDHPLSVSMCQLSSPARASAFELESPFKKIDRLCSGSVVWKRCTTCDGLLCAVVGFVEYMDPRKRVERHNSAIIIYNPAARRHEEIPWPYELPEHKICGPRSLVGFGYDPAANDYNCSYKVVVLEFPPGKTVSCWVTTSFKDQTWRAVSGDGVLEQLGKSFIFEKGSVCVDGQVYWVTRHRRILYNDDDRILRFDLRTEKFALLAVPVDIVDVLGLGQFRGSLYMYAERPMGGFDVWRMERPEKWSRVMNVDMREPAVAAEGVEGGRSWEVEPVGFLGEGEFVVKKSFDGSLAVYRLKEDKFVKLDLDYAKVHPCGYPKPVDVHLVDMETLALPGAV